MLASNNTLDYDWYHPKIRFVKVPKRQLNLLGKFSDVANALVSKAATNAGLTLIKDNDYLFVPVHELQIDNIVSKFDHIEVLPPDISLPAKAQSSIRCA